MLNTQLIRSVMIDWNKIDTDSYLRHIPAISSTERVDFTHSVTLSVKTAAVNPHCWKRSP